MRRTNLHDFFAEFRRYTLKELDFTQEGCVIDRFRTNFAGRSNVKFPMVHWSHTTRSVLTMDWVEGMRVGEAAGSLAPREKQRLVMLSHFVCSIQISSIQLVHARSPHWKTILSIAAFPVPWSRAIIIRS